MASDNALGGSSPAQDTPSSIDRQWVRIRRYGEILADFARLATCQALSNHRYAQDHERQAEPTIPNQVHDQ